MSDIHALSANQTCTCKARHIMAPIRGAVMSEPVFHYEKECGCSLSIYANKGETIADFSVLGDKAPGIGWAICPLHEAAPDLLAALEGITEWNDDQGAGILPMPLSSSARDAIGKARRTK